MGTCRRRPVGSGLPTGDLVSEPAAPRQQPTTAAVASDDPQAGSRSPERTLVGILLIGSAVSVGLGVLGRVHEPTGHALFLYGFSRIVDMKVWLGSIAAGLAMVQLTTALWMYRRIPGPSPSVARRVHRISGVAAVVVSMPVAFQCLWAFGFGTSSLRVIVHSAAGCLLYGAFVAKMLALRSHGLPARTVPVLGASVLTALVVTWATSALWWLAR
jgi:Family of unknown function (DUF6529)